MTTWDEETSSPNKAGEAYINLYNEEWRSSQNLLPDSSGFVDFRGFLGDYNILIRKNDQILSDLQFSLDQDITFDCIYDPIINQINCFNK